MGRIPTVSVIIPTFNRAKMLDDALLSVWYQTVKDLEVIVVDDGSTDDTRQVVAKRGEWVRYIRQQNQGVAAARNTGIRHAHGRYIAFLDSDDLWYPHKLERQIDYLRDHPDVGLLYARMWSYAIEQPHERRLDPYVVALSFEELLNGPNSVTTSTVVVRRECFETVGLFNPVLRGTEDHEMWLRIARRFRIAFLEEPLAEYRRHQASINGDHPGLYEAYRHLYEILLKEYRRGLRNPRTAERQLAKFEYLCGANALKQGRGRAAFKLISQSLRRDAGVGCQFARPSTPWWRRAVLPIKPYGVLLASVCWPIKPSDN